MRLLVAMTMVLAATLVAGQEKPAEGEAQKPQEGFEAAIIPVKTLSGDSFNRLAKLLQVFGARYTSDDKLRTIVVYAPKEVVAEMRRVVAELDRPGSEAAIGRNIEMTLAFPKCSTKAPEQATALPADLEPVARQLRAATQYKDIQLWDIVPLHLQEGRVTDQSMRLPGALADVPGAFPMAQIGILPEAVSRRESGRFVRFERLRIGFRIPYLTAPANKPGIRPLFQFLDLGLNTAGDIREGQKTVLGKVTGTDEDSAVFVVVSLKVLDE